MKKSSIALIVIGSIITLGVILGIILLFAFFGWQNKEIALRGKAEGQWANVETSYQRRLDLIPNLVNTVKGYADFEQETLTQVIEARSKATSVNIDPTNINSSNIQQFQQMQGELSSALSRLMVVVEKYPDLKANQNFLQLQAQLEGTENRISVERRKYNEIVTAHKIYIQSFPQRLVLGNRDLLPLFKAEEEASRAPEVNF